MNKYKVKEIPDANKYDVVPPDMNYEYFNNYNNFSFNPRNTELSISNIWFLSECSFLVYNHPGFAKIAYKLIGFDNFKFFSGIGTESMVVWNEEAIIVSFRGTELKSLSSLHELGTDMNFIPMDFELGGKVHTGFYKALEEIWIGDAGLKVFIDKISSENKKAKIWFTGHSLGGALAGLSFSYLENATGLVTFGSPRIGDIEFINITKDRPIWRVEHNNDPIVLLPPNLKGISFEFQGMGEVVYINDKGLVTDKRDELSTSEHLEIVKTTIAEQKDRRKQISSPSDVKNHIKESIKEWDDYKKIFEKDTKLNISDHMPIYYSITLWNNLVNEI